MDDVQAVQRAIMEDAAAIANRMVADIPELTDYIPKAPYSPGRRFDPTQRKRRYSISGMLFRYDPGRTQRGGMTLSMDEGVNNLPDEAITRLHLVAKAATIRAIKANGQKFGYLVAMDAFYGENYFDRFTDANEQLRLL